MHDEIRAEQAAWSGRGIARPVCISAPLVPRHSGRAFACIQAMQPLATYLIMQMPVGMAYRDAAQLCIRLYITVDGVPDSLLPLTKPKIGDAFAELAASGWVRDDGIPYASLFGAHPHEITDRGHWVEVMVSPVKKGPAVFDVGRAEELARQVGFVRREGAG